MGYKLKRILIYPDGVTEKQVYPRSWKPNSSRTLLYLPLETDTNDYSGNSRTTSATSVTFTTVGGVQSAHVGTSGGIAIGPNGFINHNTPYCTISALCYVTAATSTSNRCILEFATNGKCYCAMQLIRSGHGTFPNQYNCAYVHGGTIVANQWVHVVLTSDTSTQKLYINGQYIASGANSSGYAWGSWDSPSENGQIILNSRNGVSNSQALNGNAREIIFENIRWSDKDVVNYYQRIKNKLGI